MTTSVFPRVVHQHRTLWIVLAWVVAGLLSLPLDLPLSRMCLKDVLPGDVRALFNRAESFGHGYGLMATMITIYLLDPARRGDLPRLFASFVSAGMAANLIKLQVWRVRPRFFNPTEHGSTFLGSIWTHHDWDWTIFGRDIWQSFPSGHTAGATAMAFVLSRMYPAGRWWFYTLAFFCAMNRIDGGAHYLSDVCWGAALGHAIAAGIERAGWLRRAEPAEPAETLRVYPTSIGSKAARRARAA